MCGKCVESNGGGRACKFRSGMAKRSRTKHIGTPELIMQLLHGGPLMFLSCALGLAAISCSFDAMAVN